MSQPSELEKIGDTETDLVVPSNCCAPHYIEELGCDGLTAKEIAQSLKTTVNKVRRKLRDGNTNLLKLLNYKIRLMRNTYGVEYEDYCLSTHAAEVFVARFKNEAGDAYLEYLIRRDMAVERKCHEYERAYLEQAKRNLYLEAALEEKSKDNEDYLNEPVTPEELSLLDRTANSNLKRQGKFSNAYKIGFKNEIIQKFFNPGEEPGTYSHLSRKNFKAAILYAGSREFDWSTSKEFI